MYPCSTKNGDFVLLGMAKKERQIEQRNVWQPTRYPNLVRYTPSGTIFARFKIAGKQVRRSLKTPDLELARNKLFELQRNERLIARERRRGKMLFGEAMYEHLKSRKCDPTLRPSTKAYDDQRIKALYESWPGVQVTDVRRIDKEDCQHWADKFAKEYAPTTYNHTLSLIKHAFETAVERGVR